MQKTLITGANGFLAKYLACHLKQKKSELVAFVKPKTIMPSVSVFSNVYSDLDSLLSKEPEFSKVFHLAAFIPYGKTNQPNQKFIETNILLTSRLVQAYLSSRFIYSSSVAVYGKPHLLPLTINCPINNPDLYGLSKLAGEAIVQNHPNYGIIRFSSIIGPEMKANSFIPKTIEQAQTNQLIQLYGDGGRVQNYIDVRDASSLCLACAEFNANLKTLGVSYQSHSNREVAELIAAFTGAGINFTGEDYSPSFSYDPNDLYDRINFAPAYSMRKSIADMIDS